MVNGGQRCTHKRISLCVAQFISFHELHSFLLSCFFLGYLSQHVLSVYTRVRVDMRKKKWSTPVVVSGYSVEVIALHCAYPEKEVLFLYLLVFERKTSIKMAIFFLLVPFPFAISVGIFLVLPGRAECVGFHFKQGSHVHHITRGLSKNTYRLSKLGREGKEGRGV